MVRKILIGLLNYAGENFSTTFSVQV